MDSAIQKKLAILEAITTLHRSIGAHLELEKVSEVIVRELTRILHCAGCAVLRVKGDKAIVLAECGFATVMGAREFPRDLPAIQHITRTGAPILTGDVAVSEAAACVPTGCAMRSLICAPILVRGEVKGIIHVDSPEPNAFDEDDLDLVRILCDELALVFERSLYFSRVRKQSLQDCLTGCLNRRAFDGDLETAAAEARASQSPLSLLMIDVDWFKAYNDRHGHPKGDQLLAQLAEEIRGGVRSVDRVYRYGGEEFAVILAGVTRRDAALIAERLRRAVERRPFPGAAESQPGGRVTISIGLAEYPSDADAAPGLLAAADAALYRAKAAGRNRVVPLPAGKRARSGELVGAATGEPVSP